MKKILITAMFIASFFTTSYAEIGVNVGVSGQLGLFAATGKEVDTGPRITETAKDTEIAGVGYASLFIEKTIGDRLAIGIDYVPDALSSDTVETTRLDKTTTDARTSKENKLAIDFKDLTTLYLTLNVTDSMYLKAGYATVDIITKENLGTGGSYGNTDTDGVVMGVGYNKDFNNGTFARVEGTYMSFDSAKVTSTNSDNVAHLNSLDGVTGKISIGKSF